MKYEKIRRKTSTVSIGKIKIGSGFPVAVQSMLNTKTENTAACIAQAKALCEVGCDIIRLTVPTPESAKTIYEMKSAGIAAPLVADIHFDYRAALSAVAAGADKLRINPGNIGGESNIKAVANACRTAGIPIRIGINGGSVEKELLEKYGGASPEALAESALSNAALLEKYDFRDIVISVKSSSPYDTVSANRILAEKCGYPLHIGVTEAGSGDEALIKSAAGIGSLIMLGIGDTVRVSLTDDPVREVYAAKKLLSSLEASDEGYIDVVSCPTCGRTQINLIPICEKLKKSFSSLDTSGKRIKVAVMGCVVNGPGEAADADVGIAGGNGCAVLFRHGVAAGKIAEKDIEAVLLAEVKRIISER